MADDKRLIRNIKRKNDRKAADELFERYYREIYAYVYKQCCDKELSMDITQDIFLAAFKGLHGFDEKRSGFRTWLYRIASNKITDYYRSRQHKYSVIEMPLDDFGDELPDDHDLLEKLITEEHIASLMETVSQYGQAWVYIFQMKCFEEKTFAEIAKELNISQNTVKTRYYTIINRLRKEKRV